MASLFDTIPFSINKISLELPLEECQKICELAELSVPFNTAEKPGYTMLTHLNRRQITLKEYYELLDKSDCLVNARTLKPYVKVAILIAMNEYTNMYKLLAPEKDCADLKKALESIGFVAVVLKNLSTSKLKAALQSLLSALPLKSYCVVFFAGHGFEVEGRRYLMGVDCPGENVSSEDVLDERHILRMTCARKPELTLLLLDMCRHNMDRSTNPLLYTEGEASATDAGISSCDGSELSSCVEREVSLCVERETISCVEREASSCVGREASSCVGTVVVSCSTGIEGAAYELLAMLCSAPVSGELSTLELASTAELRRLVPLNSQYVGALLRYLGKRVRLDRLLELVRKDMQKAEKKQTPFIWQNEEITQSLTDDIAAKEEVRPLKQQLSSIARHFNAGTR